MARRVVITGMGLVSPLGVGTKHVWKRIMNGESGTISTKVYNDSRYDQLASRVVGMVPRGDGPAMLNEDKALLKYERLKVPRGLGAPIGLAAADLALADAGFTDDIMDNLTEKEKERMGLCIGSVGSKVNDIQESHDKQDPNFGFMLMLDNVAANVGARFGLKGPYSCIQTACATGIHSIGESFRMIRSGDADFMLAGGTHGPLSAFLMCLFIRTQGVTTHFNDAPETASRPFDRDRDGFVVSEGASILVLEEYEKAKARDVHIYSEILGYGMTGDAYHISSPPPGGDGAYRAMAAALKDAHQSADNVSYVNAHGTSTVKGDAAENDALVRLFGTKRASNLAVSSLKGATGHMIEGSGAFELALTTLALQKREVPPTINLNNLESTDKYPLNYVPNEAQQLPSDAQPVALKNAFGMGGTNASLCIRTI